MTEYLIQILDNTKQLIKCFKVTEEDPIPSIVPAGRTQGVTTNTTQYNAGVAFYDEHTTDAEFFWNGTDLTWQLKA